MMSASTRSAMLLVLGGVLFVRLLPAGPPSVRTENCCYTNPNYQGTCMVTPGKDETCESILEYLNKAETVGKTYCNSTRIRGGWVQVECEASQRGRIPGRK